MVTATITTPNGDTFTATNYCRNPQTKCPRAHLPSGVGYAMCRDICDQPGHAEINAIRMAGAAAHGASIAVKHRYVCEDCKSAIVKAGITKITLW